MIGNDIIDLEVSRTESNWKRRGFLEKIFSENELKIISSSENPEILVWSLWSKKEAAYKIYNRQTRIREFIPKCIECSINCLSNENLLGLVKIKELSYFTRTEITTSFIYTEAVINPNDFRKIRAIETADVYKDQNGIPSAKFSNNSVSITHHGKFERQIQLDVKT